DSVADANVTLIEIILLLYMKNFFPDKFVSPETRTSPELCSLRTHLYTWVSGIPDITLISYADFGASIVDRSICMAWSFAIIFKILSASLFSRIRPCCSTCMGTIQRHKI